MTEEGKTSNSISAVHSMLNRLKFSERHQGSSHVTDQHCRRSKNTNQCDSVFLPDSKKTEWNFTESNPSKRSVKPEGQNGADVDSEYFKERTKSRTTSTTFFKSEPQSNLLHNIRDAWQDLQPSESNSSWEKVKEDQTSQAESHFSILKNSPPHGPFTHDPTDSETGFVKGTAVPMETTKRPCRSESTEAEPPPLPPKQSKLKVHAQLQRTFTLKDFKLDLGSINLLEEICTGEEWAKFLPVKDSPTQTDAIDDSQTEDSHHSYDDIRSQNAVIKPDLSADKEQSEIGSSLASLTDSQVDRVIQVTQGTSDSAISALPKTPIRNATQGTSAVREYEQFKGDKNDFMVIYVNDQNDPTKDMPLDLSVVKSSGVLDNSALKSRIQLSKKRNHRPPGMRKKGNIKMGLLRPRSASTESSDSGHSSHVFVIGSSKFYTSPYSESSDSQTHADSQIAVLGNEKVQVRNAAVLQRISEVPESYRNDDDIAEDSMLYNNDQPSNKAKLMEVPLDFSVIKSSGVLDNSALKNRIQLSQKRKHRPPTKRKNEHAKIKLSAISFFRQRNASTESYQSHPSLYPSVFTSPEFNNLPRSYDSNDPQTPNEKQRVKDRFLKPKLWKTKT